MTLFSGDALNFKFDIFVFFTDVKEYVTRRVAFHSCLTTNLALGSTQTVIFDQDILNDGGAYNSSTGHFTAPYGGIYYFSSTFLKTGAVPLHLQMVRNDDEIVRAHAAPTPHLEIGSMTAVVSLTKGDIVKVRHYPGKGPEEVIHADWSLFTGFLIN